MVCLRLIWEANPSAARRKFSFKRLCPGTVVPATPLKLADVPAAATSRYYREQATIYTWAEPSPKPLALTLKTGLIQSNVGNTRVGLQRIGEPGADGDALLASGFPRPIPGVPPERNLSGISFAVANVTGFLALVCETDSRIRMPADVLRWATPRADVAVRA